MPRKFTLTTPVVRDPITQADLRNLAVQFDTPVQINATVGNLVGGLAATSEIVQLSGAPGFLALDSGIGGLTWGEILDALGEAVLERAAQQAGKAGAIG